MISRTKALICCIATTFIWGEAYAADVWSDWRTIGAVMVQGDAFYVAAPQYPVWSSTCPSANWLWIKRSDPGSSQLLATILAAKSSGMSISAKGNCTVDSSNFYTNQIQVN